MRPIKSRNRGVGGGRVPSGKRLQSGGMLRKVSRKRLSQLTRRRKVKKDMMVLQMLRYGTAFCELAGVMGGRCSGTLVLEHIESWRDQVKVDPERLQISCSGHNQTKASKVLDGRTETMKQEYALLADKYRKEGKL